MLAVGILYALALAGFAYTLVEIQSLKGELMTLVETLSAKFDEQSGKIDAAAQRVQDALVNVVSPADASALIAKADANDAKIDAIAPTPAA